LPLEKPIADYLSGASLHFSRIFIFIIQEETEIEEVKSSIQKPLLPQNSQKFALLFIALLGLTGLIFGIYQYFQRKK
jgi:hypothetical protein